jgi:glucosamine-6-phosphate deaminase
MRIRVVPEVPELVRVAADHAAAVLRRTLLASDGARLVAATGTSQIAFLEALVAAPGIDWTRVELFHLDEYIGIGRDHPASFRRFLEDRLIGPAGIVQRHMLDGLADPAGVARSVGESLAARPVDLLLCGIGENGHLAFNDPPADFAATAPYLIVALDEACRRQQVGEGWFGSIGEVPTHAISMSIRQILSAREIVCLVHGARKAEAVAACFSGGISPLAPASILSTHDAATVYLDREAASRLDAAAITRWDIGGACSPAASGSTGAA